MGAQDDLDRADEFLATTGVSTPMMIWDESFESWRYYGVSGQPTIILVDATGEPIKGWRGAFDEAEVLELANAST